MNYLAHLHLADQTDTSYVGSLLGDFVKGNVATMAVPTDLKIGIQLHRLVDSFTDQHPIVLDLKSKLPEHRKYGGIILDVLFDYLLAKNFGQYHPMALEQFSAHCYDNLPVDNEIMSPRFIQTISNMKQMDWLTSYGDIDTIKRVLMRISTRLTRPVALENAVDWFRSEGAIEFNNFDDFYCDLVAYAQREAHRLADRY
ncbi:DUF479 domain-containing protein [Psychrosphaera sp. B3R10]|uniref:ACP phosphodiesterase n=1 Tax=Psychrosphaera algicola TaxID=3023714 RepID=A0ABT5FD29_9GAMM|nr:MULTISPECIES: ACP phosphodiesterase [unclassified Psychrosphaera]MBU2883500.1 DUF479 domain-containing protein [Psychrosphaera sp. I2R16]MBU2989679.1 DUF479 domain-containing protein [Psychrosphaera sp. B3R10]MDC2888500.1 ACP phosphodiesterase [Psychrosphaera sp. G1-22]MDO6719880.1 ACP phosphodiesterase [Psychrosphaera sp. 1_MG-2023]